MEYIKRYHIVLLACLLALAQTYDARAVEGASVPQFIENKGQWIGGIKYSIDLKFGSMIIEQGRVAFLLFDNETDTTDHLHTHLKFSRGHVFRINYVGSNATAPIMGEDKYPFHNNYYLGKDRRRWASDVRLFAQSRYKDLYHNIDLVFKGNNGLLEYQYEIAPGGDPSTIKAHYEGVDGMTIDNGILKYKTTVTDIQETKPYAYQIIHGQRHEVSCTYVIRNGDVGFAFPDGYDKTLPLVIDPTLIFSSYTGSYQNNFGFTAAFDSTGNLYAGGICIHDRGNLPQFVDSGYPITPGAIQRLYGGGASDVSLSKFNTAGSVLLYSTYLGGRDSEVPSSLIVNHKNELIIYGITGSDNFPVTPNGFDTVFHAGTPASLPYNGTTFNRGTDIFLTKLDSNGHMMVSTFVGGTGNDGLNINNNTYLAYNYADAFRGEVIVDSADNIYVATCTSSPTLYTTLGSQIRDTLLGVQDGLVIKINTDLDSLYWQAYVGGNGVDALYSMDLDTAGNIYAAGGTTSSDFATSVGSFQSTPPGDRDGIVVKVSNNGSAILAATYLGTTAYDQAFFLKIGPDHNIYTTGQTTGPYPITAGKYRNGAGKQFIQSLDPTLTTSIFSTVFGSGSNEVNISPTAFLVDHCGRIYVAGWGGEVNLFQNGLAGTTDNMAITADAHQAVTDGSDFYFIVLDENADSLLYATYYGGIGGIEHVDGGTSRFDPRGVIYEAVCAGCKVGSSISNFPTTPGVVSNVNNCVNDCNMGVIKFEFRLSNVAVNVSASPSASGCVPLRVGFSSAAINALTYEWDFGDGTASTAANPIHVYTDTGTFHVRLIGNNPNLCAVRNIADTAYLTVIVGDDSVVAKFDQTVLNYCDSFYVGLTNHSIGASQYLWDFGDSTTSTLASPTHVFTQPGVHIIQLIAINPDGCNISDTFTSRVIFQPRLVAAIATHDTMGCAPFTTTFTNVTLGDNHLNFTWDFGDGSPLSTQPLPTHTYNSVGQYTVLLTVTDTGTCNQIIHDTLHVTATRDTLQAGFDLSILKNVCDTLNVQLTDRSFGGSILYYFGDSTTSAIASPQHSYYQPDTFDIIQVVTGNFCRTQDTARNQVVLLPRVRALFTPFDGCVPYTYRFNNNSTNAATYLWHFQNETSTLGNPTVNYTDTGLYNIALTAYNPNSCNDSSSFSASFRVYPVPTAGFTTDSNTYQVFQDITFNNTSSIPAHYDWTFGDGNSSNQFSPIHRYRNDAVYYPCIKVTDQHGCLAEYCDTLNITFLGVMDVPNAFTPNGDGSNDILYVRGYGVEEMEFRIYNRWGELVFESHRLEDGWDGTYKGSAQEMEVYTYTLSGKYKNGLVAPSRKGNITLLR